MNPSVGRIVHYVSYPGPGGVKQECRAAIVTAVQPGAKNIDVDRVSLAVFNPTGTSFDEARYNDGAERPGSPDCPLPHATGPMRYCQCGWTEATLIGGTWHWPEREA